MHCCELYHCMKLHALFWHGALHANFLHEDLPKRCAPVQRVSLGQVRQKLTAFTGGS